MMVSGWVGQVVAPSPLVPAKAGTQNQKMLDSRLRGNERSVKAIQSKLILPGEAA